MRLSTILVLVLLAHTSGASAQTRQPESAPIAAATNAEDEIKKLEEMRNQAILHGDGAVLDRMTSDDYTFITLRGRNAHETGDSQWVHVWIVPLQVAANP